MCLLLCCHVPEHICLLQQCIASFSVKTIMLPCPKRHWLFLIWWSWIWIYGHYWYSIPSFHEESDLNDVLRQMGWWHFFATGSNSRSALRKRPPGWSTLHAWLSKPIRDSSFHLVQLRFIFYACRVSFNLSILSVGRHSSIASMYSSIPSIGMQVDGPSVFWGATGKPKLLHTCRAFWRRCLHSEEPGGPMIIKQDLNIENVKGCRDGMPKSMRTR